MANQYSSGKVPLQPMQYGAPTILFANLAGQLLADSAGFLRVNWSEAPRALVVTQELFAHMLQQLQRRKWGRILISQAGMQPFTSAEQHWIAHDWLPRAVQEGGYRYGAVVVSPEVLVRLATAYITTHVQGLPLLYRSFDNEAAAVRWLSQQPSTPTEQS